MKLPTEKNLADIEVAIERGRPSKVVRSVSLEDYRIALRCVEFWENEAIFWKERTFALEEKMQNIIQVDKS